MSDANGDGRWALPEGWVWTTIGEATQPIQKVRPEDEPEKPFTYLDISGIDNKRNVIAETKTYYGVNAPSRARQRVEAEDVLFSTVRTYLRNIAVVPSAYDGEVASTGFSILRGASGVNSKYLFYYSLTDSFLDALEKLQRGTSYPAVRDSDVRDQPLPLAPLPDQHRIVAEIEKQFTRLDAAVAALRRARANLARYKAAVLQAAVTGRLVAQDAADEPAGVLLGRVLAERRAQWQAANPKKQYVEPKGVEGAGLPGLPVGWVWATLPQLGELARGKSKHRPRNDPKLYGGKYPFIQTGDVRNAEGTITSYSQTYNEVGLAQSRLWPDGTLCITIAANIADTAITSFDACFPDSIVGFRVDEKHCSVRFVEYFIRTIKSRLEEFAPATAQKNINVEVLERIPIPLPPLREQKAIVSDLDRRFSILRTTETAIDAALARAERLRQGVLGKAFRGELVGSLD